eukprot:s2481_g6.t1
MSDRPDGRCRLLRAAVLRSSARWLPQNLGYTPYLSSSFTQKIATDCSGLDTPAFAAEACEIPFEQLYLVLAYPFSVFSQKAFCLIYVSSSNYKLLRCTAPARFASDSNPSVRLWLKENGRAKMIFEDILARPLSSLPENVTGYIAGFPCQPYSRQSAARRAFRDPRAKVFFACLQTACHLRPDWIVLENVKGIMSYKRQLLASFKRFGLLEKYLLCVLPLCPSIALQEPHRRPRIYFIMVRRDAALTCEKGVIAKFFAETMVEIRQSLPAAKLTDFLDARAIAPASQATSSGSAKRYGTKWVKKHNEARPGLGLAPSAHSSRSAGGFLTPRESSAVEMVLARAANRGKQFPCVLDVSQSFDRMPVGWGCAPCLTTSSKLLLVSSGARRLLSAAEKLQLLGLPAKVCSSRAVPVSDLHAMAGNGMHLRAVAVAMMLAMSLTSNKKVSHSGALADSGPLIFQWKAACLLLAEGTSQKVAGKRTSRKKKAKAKDQKTVSQRSCPNRKPKAEARVPDAQRVKRSLSDIYS